MESDGWADGTAVAQLAARGIPASKVVVGKPVTESDATNTGFVSLPDLVIMFQTAAQRCPKGWNAGVMAWQLSSDVAGRWSLAVAKALKLQPGSTETETGVKLQPGSTETETETGVLPPVRGGTVS